jgi:hypothetical protein
MTWVSPTHLFTEGIVLPPTTTPLLYVLLISNLVLLTLLIRRRHREEALARAALAAHEALEAQEAGPAAQGDADTDEQGPVEVDDRPEEVRLLKMQVDTLTEALHDSEASRGPVAPTYAPPTSPAPESVVDTVVEPVAEAATDLAPEPVTPADLVDHTAHDYADLSRAFAGAGRLREAVLAQWAADLRVLAPLLAGREQALHDGLAGLAPADAASAITAARAVAAGLLTPGVEVTAVLADAGHLSDPAARTGAPVGSDVSADVLPDRVVRALETALVGSADRGDDTTRLTVGLRCDLVAHVLPGHDAAEATDLVRAVLEPHERATFDALLLEQAS